MLLSPASPESTGFDPALLPLLTAEERQELDQLLLGVPYAAPLAEWIPRNVHGYSNPAHLRPLLDLLEEADHHPVEAVVHAPPRHAKTESILAAMARSMKRDPRKTHAYATYEANLARSKSRRVRDLAARAGVHIRGDATALHEWRTREGGGLLATGVMGPLTGQGVSGLLVIDDPFKNRVEAESATRRRTISDWFKDVAYTRREPGCSVIIVMTRWHPDDLAGEKIRDGWRFIRLPALTEAGQALWPSRYNEEELEKIRSTVGEFTWTSLYQGLPRSRGGCLFEDVHSYGSLPTTGYKVSVGFDLAYSKKTSADYSVAVILVEAAGMVYVADVVRRQERAAQFKARARDVLARYPFAKRRWYCSGTEEGVADLFRSPEPDPAHPGKTLAGVDLGEEPATADKFVRAQPVAAAWNAGKLLVPESASWLEAFIAEVCGFTGVNDDHDDQVDALAAAFDALHTAVPTFGNVERPKMLPRRW